MTKDQIYQHKIHPLPKFTFNDQVAEAFDDMISRSVPCYTETQDLIVKTALHFYQPNTLLYDLGCSTGQTISEINKHQTQNISMIGLDSSKPMIKKAQEKCKQCKNAQFISADIVNYNYSPASVFLLIYVLQFLKQTDRIKLLTKIYQTLHQKGVLILFEKIKSHDFYSDYISLHEQFKAKNGYSQMEISQKKEALENVLIPLSYEENQAILQNIGFKNIEKCFQYLNFCGIIAQK